MKPQKFEGQTFSGLLILGPQVKRITQAIGSEYVVSFSSRCSYLMWVGPESKGNAKEDEESSVKAGMEKKRGNRKFN